MRTPPQSGAHAHDFAVCTSPLTFSKHPGCRAWRFSAAATLALLLGACATPGPGSRPALSSSTPQAPAPVVVAPAASAAALSAATPAEPVSLRLLDSAAGNRVLNPDDEAARTDLWARIRAGYAIPDLEGERVAKWERFYAERPDYVQRMTDRSQRYLFHIVEAVARRGLPMELALVPFGESAFNPVALSTAKAAGIWQFMPGTGRDFDLKQNVFRDDRRGVIASTEAALDYLERLHGQFGDWHLAMAAYNWGPGNVQRAVARNQARGVAADYESLRMPLETQDYVPKMQALANIVADPARFGLELPPLKNHPYFVTIPIERDVDVERVVELAGITMEEFRYLNPQIKQPVILANGTSEVLLPYEMGNTFVHRLGAYRGPLASWTAWQVPRTMSPAQAAKEADMDEATLREVNRIPPRMLLRQGATLLVARRADHQSNVSELLADNGAMLLTPDAPPMRRITLRAGKKGESVAAVAKRYKVTAAQVASWNKTKANARFKPKSTIVVYVPADKQRAAAGKRLASTKAGASSKAAKVSSKAPSKSTRKASASGSSSAKVGSKTKR